MTALAPATVTRRTLESAVDVSLTLHGEGASDVATGFRFLDHMLGQWAFHCRLDLTLHGRSLDGIAHHLIEEVALALGAAVDAALADRAGIERYGAALIPMDDALARVAVDFSGRPYTYFQAAWTCARVEGLETEMIAHFFSSFAVGARATVHAECLRGANAHHCIEALFKALGRACGAAWQSSAGSRIASTKGSLA